MGITLARHQAHVVKFEAQFPNYRKAWPKFLYRHEPIDNVIEILREGALLSRADAFQRRIIINDIAPNDIINRNDAAHNFARLYFRPRNPTQFHVEGIRKPEDFFQGKHGGFLVMLLFNSEKVLTTHGTQFSCGNMQSGTSTVQDGDHGFDVLNFDAIYHDIAYPDANVIRQRCAEVLPVSPFPLEETLEHIVVRTDADVLTLKYLLSNAGLATYLPKVRKTTGGGIFFDWYTAFDFIDTAPGRIIFKVRPSRSNGDIATQLDVFSPDGQNKLVSVDCELLGATTYFIEHTLAPGQYLAIANLEGCFAHKSMITIS